MIPAPTDNVLSPAQTLVDGRIPQRYSAARRYSLLLMFCCAQFLDAFNNSALFSAIPALTVALHMDQSQATWIISAFQLTFASFLLIVRLFASAGYKCLLTSHVSHRVVG